MIILLCETLKETSCCNVEMLKNLYTKSYATYQQLQLKKEIK